RAAAGRIDGDLPRSAGDDGEDARAEPRLDGTHRRLRRAGLRERQAGRLAVRRSEQRNGSDERELAVRDGALRVDGLTVEARAADHVLEPRDGGLHERKLL